MKNSRFKSSNTPDFRTLLFANFITALVVLLMVKAALTIYTVSGAEGKTEVFKTAIKSILLCTGSDIVGAVLVSVIIMLFAVPLGKFIGEKTALFASVSLQILHTTYLVISYSVNKVLGTPFEKAAIDGALLSTESSASTGVTAENPIWGSVTPFLTPTLIFFTAVLFSTVIVLVLLIYKNKPKFGEFTKSIALFFLITFALLTTIILPNIRNGEYLGVRIHTYGLERSHFVTLLESYILSPIRYMAIDKTLVPDPFCLDLSPITNSNKALNNPLMSEAETSNGLPNIVPQKTNLIFVLMESVGARYLDKEKTVMPFLQSLSMQKNALSLSKHFTHWPMTMKSIFNLLCSELPHPEYQPITHTNPSIKCVSLPEVLKDAGYDTALFTSQDLAYDRQLKFYKHRKLDLMYDFASMPKQEGVWKSSWGIDDAHTIRTMFDWIDKKTEKNINPFFAYYQMAVPHHPYEYPGGPAPAEPGTDQEFLHYLDCLTYADNQLRQLFQALDDRELLDKTLVVIVSDHGEGFSQHFGGLGRTHGSLVYNEFIHVPMIITGPQLSGIKENIEFNTGHIDLAPTMLALLGLDIPFTMKGRNLLVDKAPQQIIAAGRAPTSQISITDNNWKLVFTQDTGLVELFDLDKDPFEQTNVIEKNQVLADKLKQKIQIYKSYSRNLIENYSSILRQRDQQACD